VSNAKVAVDERAVQQQDVKSKMTEGMSAAAIAAMESSLKNFSEEKIDGATSAKSFEHTHIGN